jgi:DinB family protein
VKRARAVVGRHVKHTRASVLKRAEAEYQAIDAIVRRLRPADFRRYVFDERAPVRWTVKDVIAHVTAWTLRDVRRLSRDRSPLKAYEAPYDRQANRRIYERSHRTAATTVVAEHRAAHRAMVKALRQAPADRFAKRRSPYWPYDLVGHVGSHRRMHLDPLFAKSAKH